ncbi:hypothetical protein F5Y03DRAFT_299282 [Xylaria venustula]|nr:hypothetical protein F5Y03DRAFT_299282 [Xylaria venustula]
MPITTREARHILVERLDIALNLGPEEVEKFKYFCTAASYFKLHDHEGGVARPGTRHYRRGKEYTYDHVPWKAILDSAETMIKQTADVDARTGIFETVMRGLPGRKRAPGWDKTPDNPNAEPTTPYSRYRAKEGEEAPSNAQMLKSFGEAAGLDDNTLNFISAQITWWDSTDAKGDSAFLSLRKKPAVAHNGDSDVASTTTPTSSASRIWVVGRGRLGRDHTFADVPSHYARDRLVHYTLTELDSDKRDRVLAALCLDLNQSEITTYSKLIAPDQEIANQDEERGLGVEKEASESRVLRKRDGNRGHKRTSEGDEGDKDNGKAMKRTRTRKSQA